jgi:hypothetical protein
MPYKNLLVDGSGTYKLPSMPCSTGSRKVVEVSIKTWKKRFI